MVPLQSRNFFYSFSLRDAKYKNLPIYDWLFSNILFCKEPRSALPKTQVPSCTKFRQGLDGAKLISCQFRAGHFRYFLFFSIRKLWFFAFCEIICRNRAMSRQSKSWKLFLESWHYRVAITSSRILFTKNASQSKSLKKQSVENSQSKSLCLFAFGEILHYSTESEINWNYIFNH